MPCRPVQWTGFQAEHRQCARAAPAVFIHTNSRCRHCWSGPCRGIPLSEVEVSTHIHTSADARSSPNADAHFRPDSLFLARYAGGQMRWSCLPAIGRLCHVRTSLPKVRLQVLRTALSCLHPAPLELTRMRLWALVCLQHAVIMKDVNTSDVPRLTEEQIAAARARRIKDM